ncbi:MAG: S9 family peptidase [Alphaproteobacteria bacterium]|nr:S9 family peptidase [Alphaproteobacteria bacterium]
MRPPVAKTIAHETEIHGHRRTDPYAWLKNKDDPEVIAYLEAENAYAEHEMAQTEALQKTLYEEMVGRIQETDLSVPVRIGSYLYYSRTEEGRQYPIFCRKEGDDAAEEEVLLDLNAEALGLDYLSLGLFEVSPDHRILAYSLDTTGAESYRLRFKDLASGAMLADEIDGVSYGLEWANDNRTVFYTVEDHAKRPYRLLRHELGQTGDDAIVFEEPDELFRVGLAKTKDHAFLMLRVASIETSECRLLDADLGEPAFRLIEPRDKGHRYSVEHRDGLLYILSNRDAPNFKLMTAPVASPEEANWREMIAHDPGIMLNGLDMFEDFLAIYERRSGLRSIRVLTFEDQSEGSSAPLTAHEIAFDEPVYTVSGGRNPMYRSRTLRFSYTSLTTPASVYDYDMVTKERALLKRQPVLGDFDVDDYESERLFVTAGDGAKIPISLVYRKGLAKDGANPCLLYGYGAYGASMDPGFSSHRLSLLDRGVIYAIAHVRGGQEMGRQWYDQGKFLAKRNTFDDFIAAGKALIEGGYTRNERLAIMGGSAGGLLVGAVLNMAPDLVKAAVAKVPFVDVVDTMLDHSLPLTIPEYEEWGDPNDPDYFDYILGYSPYDNVEAKAYPEILVTAGLNDPRVHYWEPAKWTAKLRALKTDDNRLLLKTNMGAGHGGASGRYDALKELAFDYAFILDALGVAKGDEAGV